MKCDKCRGYLTMEIVHETHDFIEYRYTCQDCGDTYTEKEYK